MLTDDCVQDDIQKEDTDLQKAADAPLNVIAPPVNDGDGKPANEQIVRFYCIAS